MAQVWEERYLPAEDVEAFTENCRTAGEKYKEVNSAFVSITVYMYVHYLTCKYT